MDQSKFNEKNTANEVLAIDLFCGCGGVTEGLKQAGFTVIAAVDNDPICCQTYLKASDDTQRNTVITNLVKKNYFMSQVDKYIYKYDVNKNEGYILGDLGKKSTKVWNIVTAD